MKYEYDPIQEKAITDAVEYIRNMKRKLELYKLLCVISVMAWFILCVCLWMK